MTINETGRRTFAGPLCVEVAYLLLASCQSPYRVAAT